MAQVLTTQPLLERRCFRKAALGSPTIQEAGSFTALPTVPCAARQGQRRMSQALAFESPARRLAIRESKSAPPKEQVLLQRGFGGALKSTVQDGEAPAGKGDSTAQPSELSAEVSSSEVSDRADKEKGLSLGVKAALGALRFYKREISPWLPGSCRYQPTCSQYAVQAYTKFGFVKGSILTAWRLIRCNPLGTSGYDPPRWPPSDCQPID
ncbi:hypothetical protein KFL_000220105 [Klebsormidium nitens]|uniref:Membrane protein insertion efficiency factor n=1 Tax=Klebsormidium nitens TaxID=105231 RepID=A0A1Y1HP49_KLENI|nr:hypothetical protein KFL_000220105 [Klebsormidium nitens]|eukprot:GAQ78979.1 hypothetical protein KFL_000220105 [Klebsormidium nitens]